MRVFVFQIVRVTQIEKGGCAFELYLGKHRAADGTAGQKAAGANALKVPLAYRKEGKDLGANVGANSIVAYAGQFLAETVNEIFLDFEILGGWCLVHFGG